MIRLKRQKPRTARRAPRRHFRSSGTGGFTLMEALMMIAIVTIGMSAVLYLMAVSENLNMDSKQTTAAYAGANDLMEYFRQQPFTQVTDVTNAAFGAASGQIGYNSLSQLPNAQGTYTIADYLSSTTIRQVTVTVKWSRHSATRDMTVSLVTLIAQNGINERWK